MLVLYNLIDPIARLIVNLSRIVIIVSGVALTIVTTANVLARYMLSSGGFSFAQELPMLIFPWFILSGIVLAAYMGGHMAVEWLYDKLHGKLRLGAFALSGAISIASFLVLAYQSVLVAEIASVESSPVLGIPNSVGYYALAVGALLISVVTVAATLRVFKKGWEYRIELAAVEIPL
ncbi:TRAP transporter small permease subunit [bacterium M00.F.Ca.ET.194.01.1.1]|nr:TRAP transporter small permease subunit [bacterium M00.F.Ca.ET.194.01.1.1]TGS52146.1 TRAP transporter small permease subunit [bacterium M00.F.Ca.ET.179.01.1.1]TGV43294.1 TRAP transporter small permease subunit [bacterium M00.F.Ca.ET.168.01.1.1]